MIGYELLLLGLLKECPKHGYEIKKRIKDILFLFAGIDLKSIYYPLRVLERKSLVIKRTTKKGKRPLRFVYSLTAKGKNRFQELLKKSFFNFKRPEFSLDLSLYFLNYIKPDIARRRLRGRIFILNRIAKGLKQMFKNQNKKGLSTSLACILQHNLKMLEAESRFLAHLIKTL